MVGYGDASEGMSRAGEIQGRICPASATALRVGVVATAKA